MAVFAAVLEQDPKDPMESEWIGVQSRGMKQWISARMADQFGISANTRFLFPKQIVDHILFRAQAPSSDTVGPDASQFFWSILDQLMAKDLDKSLLPVQNYINDDDSGKKRFQLARRIATLFDDYMVYRPQLLLKWQDQADRFQYDDPHMRWQAQLWNRMVQGQKTHHLAWQAHHYLTQTGHTNLDTNLVPGRLSFFGISALPPVFLQVFEKLSDIVDIHLFLLAPSPLFFFDIKSKAQTLKSAVQNDREPESPFLDQETNPLLASLGRAGQDFFSQIESFNYHEPGPDLFSDPARSARTMLTIMQSDIMNLVLRKSGGQHKPVPLAPQDRSISIHSCHSPMREAQVLKDLLLDAFELNPALCPHDVIVMMPDIETYAPYIESVFNLEQTLPYSLSDRLKRLDSSFLEAFLMILSLSGSRLEQKQVLDLISNPAVLKKFGFEPADILNIELMIVDANILWGKDGAHRQNMGVPGYEQNTWVFGLNRLFMGMAMPEGHDSPVAGVMGCDRFEGSQLELLGRFARFCDALFCCLDKFCKDQTIDQWCRIMVQAADTLLAPDKDSNETRVFLTQTIDTIKKQARDAGFEQSVSFEVITALLTHQLDLSVSQGSFLAGRITFCNIMPMRSIPYKVVALMGMDEAAFPRQVFGSGFDLIKNSPQLGDKNERQEDRYLFLETLLSAREKVIITYTGQDIRDNSPIPCAGPVSELMDAINDSFEFEKPNEYHIVHPLHPFDAKYFDAGEDVFSFSRDNCRIAASMGEKTAHPAAFIQSSSKNCLNPHPDQVNMEDFIRFFRHPVEWMLKQHMGILLMDNQISHSQREPFSLSGFEQYKLGSRLLDKALDSHGPHDVYPDLKAMGTLPFGQKGKHEYKRLQSLAAPVMEAGRSLLSAALLPPVAGLVTISEIMITAQFNDIRENGSTQVSFGKLNGSRLLSAWIRHLCANAILPQDYPKMSRIIGRHPDGKEGTLFIEFDALEDRAEEYLESLIKIYRAGMTEPVCFFCETGYAFAKVLAKKSFDIDQKVLKDAAARAGRYWAGDRFLPGEKQNRYVTLCFREKDPFDTLESLEESGFIDHVISIFKPLFQHMRMIKK